MEFQNQMYQAFPEHERRNILETNCDAVEENQHFSRPLTQQEITNAKDVFAEKAIAIADIEDQKKAACAVFDAQLKTLKIEGAELRGQIKTGQVDAIETIYTFHDQTSGYAKSYDANGFLVKNRLLTPKEQQVTTMRALHENTRQNESRDYRETGN